MSHILFIDESGQDRCESSYDVLAGIAIEDRDLWNLICRVQDAEVEFFGCRVSDGLLALRNRWAINKAMPACAHKASDINSGREPGELQHRIRLLETGELYSSHIPALKTLISLGWRYLSLTECLTRRDDNRSKIRSSGATQGIMATVHKNIRKQ